MRAGQALNRTAAVAVLACCAGTGLLAAPALAATGDVTVKPPVVKTNWYWAEKSPTVGGMPTTTLPDQANDGSNIPAGALGVALVSSDVSPADKVAAVDFDLTTIPLSSTFSSFTITVPLDAAATQVMSSQPDIAACENIDTFADGPGAEDLAKAPPHSAPSCVKGTFSAAKGYTFNLTAMANDWAFGAPAFGISLVPGTVAAGTPGYSIALKGKNGIVTSASYAAPAAAPAAPAAPPAAEVPQAPVAQAPLPAIPEINSGGAALTPTVPEVSAPAPETAVALPAPQTIAVPQPPATVLTASFVSASARPTTSFWLALLLGALLLGAAVVVFSDPLAPAPVDARRRRFAL